MVVLVSVVSLPTLIPLIVIAQFVLMPPSSLWKAKNILGQERWKFSYMREKYPFESSQGWVLNHLNVDWYERRSRTHCLHPGIQSFGQSHRCHLWRRRQKRFPQRQIDSVFPVSQLEHCIVRHVVCVGWLVTLVVKDNPYHCRTMPIPQLFSQVYRYDKA